MDLLFALLPPIVNVLRSKFSLAGHLRA